MRENLNFKQKDIKDHNALKKNFVTNLLNGDIGFKRISFSTMRTTTF